MRPFRNSDNTSTYEPGAIPSTRTTPAHATRSVAPTCELATWRMRMHGKTLPASVGGSRRPSDVRFIRSAGGDWTAGLGAPPHPAALAVRVSLPTVRESGTTTDVPAAVAVPNGLLDESVTVTVAPGGNPCTTAKWSRSRAGRRTVAAPTSGPGPSAESTRRADVRAEALPHPNDLARGHLRG